MTLSAALEGGGEANQKDCCSHTNLIPKLATVRETNRKLVICVHCRTNVSHSVIGTNVSHAVIGTNVSHSVIGTNVSHSVIGTNVSRN
jgi:hypothetical protein